MSGEILDVAIIGAGLTGLSAARHLFAKGHAGNWRQIQQRGFL